MDKFIKGNSKYKYICTSYWRIYILKEMSTDLKEKEDYNIVKVTEFNTTLPAINGSSLYKSTKQEHH